jgi:HAD superfamily hydrolase (TIGR01490 family)
MSARRRIAVYDLDRTVTRWPTYSHFLLRSAWRISPHRLLLAPLLPPLMLLYKARLFSRDRLKVLMWAVLLGRADGARLDAAVAEFVSFTLRRNIRAGAPAQLREDRARGAMLVLATAAQEIYARPIAEALGFDAVIATRAAVADDGRVGPALLDGNVYGNAKLAALERFLSERSIARGDASITFYSDSASDRPVFAWCDAPVAVAPSRKLAQLAERSGWPVVDWG